MAKAAETEGAAPPKSKKLLIIVIAAVVLILGLGGGAAYFLMRGGDHEADDEEVVVEKAKTDKKKEKSGKETLPVYVALEAFTVNLIPENGEQFLQIILSVEVDDLKTGDKVKSYTPKLRNNIMMLLSSKKASELLTREGKEKLSGEIRDMVSNVLEPGSAGKRDAPVKEVLFTSFIIQ